MKNISSNQSKRLRKFNKIKRNLSPFCVICGAEAADAAHLLPRSLYPEYYTEEWNIVPMCRLHHDMYDSDRAFRRSMKFLVDIVKSHDQCAANRYFDL